jgi:hypothetical protein
VTFQGNVGEQRRVLSLEGGKLVIAQTNPGRNAGGPTKVGLHEGVARSVHRSRSDPIT